MKKIFTLVILAIFLPLTFAFANYDSDEWSYLFHLQYKEGVLGVNSSEKYPYVSIPQLFTATEDPKTTDFTGTVISGKGKELAKFGFNKPTSIVISLGKSILDVSAPYFANADHVTFFDKNGKRLFDVSLRGSSFCNDNNVCNADVGENSVNCSNDCVGEGRTPTQTIPPPIENTITPTEETTITPIAEIIDTTAVESPTPIASEGAIVPDKSRTTITLIVGSILILLTGFMFFYHKRKSDSTTL